MVLNEIRHILRFLCPTGPLRHLRNIKHLIQIFLQSSFNFSLNLLILQLLIHSIEVSISIGTFRDRLLEWLFLLRNIILLLLILASPILRLRSPSTHLITSSNRWIILILLCLLEYGLKWLHILSLSIIVKRPHIIEVTEMLHMVACPYRSLRLLIITLSSRPIHLVI